MTDREFVRRMSARIVATRFGNRVHLTVLDDGEMVVQFRLTDDQALRVAGDLLRAAGKDMLIDAAKFASPGTRTTP